MAHAFMAIGEDPELANESASIIQSNSGDNQDTAVDAVFPLNANPPINPINTTDSEDFTIGNLSQGEDANKLQINFKQIFSEFKKIFKILCG